MRNKVLLLLVFVIMAGCSPQRRLARLLDRYPPDTTIHIEYRDTIIYRDTIVFKYLPGETEVRNVYVEVPRTLPDTIIWAETSLAYAAAHLSSNHLGLELIQNDTMFRWLLDSALVHNIDTMIITKKVPYPVIEKAKPFYKNGFFILAGILLISLILLFVFRRK